MKRWPVALIALALTIAACDLQPLEDPGIGDLALTTIVYASDGSVLAEWHAEVNRTPAAYADFPQHLIDAVVAIEDERYWSHPGVDLQAVARAVVANIGRGEIIQGASTITQQYLKNVLLTPEVTAERKITEAALALRLEEGLSKEDILERYLNTAYFGSGAYGVAAAAERLLGKAVPEITLAEAALLAGLIRSPSSSDPYRDPEGALTRRRVVLDKMVEVGWLSPEAASSADAEPLTLRPRQVEERSLFPYFTEEVKRRLLADPNLGETLTDRANLLFKGGLRIYTTLDPIAQQAAHDAIAAVIPEDGPSAALAAIEPTTGYVRALVGGHDFYDLDDPVAKFNLATQGARQAGSSFKPFVLAAALETGIGLNDVIQGGRAVVIQTPSGPWVVENYAGSTFPSLSVLEATVFSVNVVFARLVAMVGPVRVVDVARSSGIESDLKPYYSLALGAQEVNPLEMASAYGTFAANGIHVAPQFVTAIENYEGINFWSPIPIVTEAVTPGVAQAVTGALTEVVRRGTGSRAQIGRPAAGKTGTSQSHHDAWFVGYTPELSAAVWVGFPEGQVSMEPPLTPFPITGGTWPAQVWAAFASNALANTSFGQLSSIAGDGLVTVEVDLGTGFLAGPYCPRQDVQLLRLPADAVPTVICPVHNPQGIITAGAGTVPDAIGEDLGSATSLLAAAGFQVRVEWSDGGGLSQGTVFNQLPSPGFPAQAGTYVTVTVAGPEPGSVIPSVLGFPRSQAEHDLDELGLAVKVIVEAEANATDAARRSGAVWKQDPGRGAEATGTVTIWVNP